MKHIILIERNELIVRPNGNKILIQSVDLDLDVVITQDLAKSLIADLIEVLDKFPENENT